MKPHGGSPAPARLALLLLLACGGALAQSSSGGTPPPAQPVPPAAISPEAAAAADPASQPAQGEEDKKIKLPKVNVQGNRNVFNDNDKKLKELQESLPCTGCDAKPHTKKKLVKRVLDAVGERVLPTEAPDHSDRDANDKAKEFSQQNTCTAGNVGGCVPDNVKP
ncbi:MAG TPA: hypothetical protein VFA75_17140 [Nevskia sp.]|jgi:hypothetical protein|nr:hypothetical protein [Nevskia sp.]